MQESTFASADETLQHMRDKFAKYGEIQLTVWVTTDGKWIDESVLQELVAAGKLTYTPPQVGNIYSEPHYYLVVEPEPIPQPVEAEPTKPVIKPVRVKKQSIQVQVGNRTTTSKPKFITIEAFVAGAFAVHGYLSNDDIPNPKLGYTLTYIGNAVDSSGESLSGLCIFSSIRTKSIAIDLAQEANSLFGGDNPQSHSDYWRKKYDEYRMFNSR